MGAKKSPSMIQLRRRTSQGKKMESSEADDEEEEKLFQMDFNESLQPNTSFISPPPPPSHPIHLPHNSTHLSLQETLLKSSDVETVVLDKILFYLQETENSKILNLNRWIIMRLKMDNFEASLCKTSWISTFGRPSGDYEYIDVMMKGENEEGICKRLIVDMDFKSQFVLARQTEVYSELVNCLPCIFVGTEEKLNSIISLICPAAKQCLKEKGLHIPPWRKFSYMQSKWLSENCKKVSFSPPRGAEAQAILE